MAAHVLCVTPADALIDVPRSIRVERLAPGQPVTVAASTRRSGVQWRSEASFEAGADGVVDTARDAPVSGSYSWARRAASSSTSRWPSRW